MQEAETGSMLTGAPTTRRVRIGSVTVANDLPFVLIAGPCQIEGREHAFAIAARLVEMCGAAGVPLIFKSSYDKANRSSLSAMRGVGIEQGLQILSDIREKFGCPVLTDVHQPADCARVGQAVDVLQIPAFLCRQTDLLVAAGETGKAINVKKGQFLAPWEMQNVAKKITSTGNEQVLLCDRGTFFGYNNLVSDLRALPIMAATGYPVVFDATHSVQQPGALGDSSGGQRQFASILARAAAAVGTAAIFMETHQDPDRAPSDGATMIQIDDLPACLSILTGIDCLTKAHGGAHPART
jgi:2-dehydro-3-deoxyphosphooctonate aldolase (KDO 8-P synthase)